MKKIQALLLVAFFSVLLGGASAHARKLSDYPHFEYDVRFTNPECPEYRYSRPVRAADGSPIAAKPRGAYCKGSDLSASARRPGSVHTKLLQWINDPSTKEIFFTYLSFSNAEIGTALCEAVQRRGVKLTFILDAGLEEEGGRDPSRLREANRLASCRSRDGSSPVFLVRGHQPGLGFAHNKLLIVNPSSSDRIRLVFSSGNLSAGVALHHENWNFVTTHASSYFAQSQLCLMRGMIDHAQSAREYRAFIQACRSEIRAEPETDVRSFFVPGEGDEATALLDESVRRARRIQVAAHRFSYNRLIEALAEKGRRGGADIRVVTDDDTYWVGTTGKAVGPNLPNEYRQLTALSQLGTQVRYLETNHRERLLHHNKFIVFDQSAVFTGAGNLTGDAFTKNLENFYFITIPAVVKAYARQYEYLWGIATAPEKMPAQDVHP